MEPISDEADILIKRAEKCLKTSFFRRSPDYDKAIECYLKAAVTLRKRGMNKMSADLYFKVAELLEKVEQYFQAAKNYETASILYKETDQLKPAVDSVIRAAELLQKSGSVDSATNLYARAAKSLEYRLPDHAAQFFEKAAEVCNVEEKYNEAADYCHNSARIFVRLRQTLDAERLLRMYITNCLKANASEQMSVGDTSVYNLVARGALVLILLKLFDSDTVAAVKMYAEAVNEWKFNETEEGVLAKNLISAFEEHNRDLLNNLLRKPLIRNLDLAYTELIEQMKTTMSTESICCGDVAPSSHSTGQSLTLVAENDTEASAVDTC